MNTKLITGLRTAAAAIEQETFYYNWHKPQCCNCGSLFCALTGQSAAQLAKRTPAAMGNTQSTWRNIIGQHCPITGMPKHELFKELFGYGLTQLDMINLENLSDRRVLEHMSKTTTVSNMVKRKWYQFWKPKTAWVPLDKMQLERTDKKCVIAYMRAWADLLTEDGALDTPQTTPSPCQVTVQS